MRILFIGGTGNITTDCTRLLYERGHEIGVLTRGTRSIPDGYRAFRADRTDRNGMRDAVRGWNPEVVVNFLGFEVSDLEVDRDVFGNGLQQYVFISSATVYEKPPRKLPLTEDGPLGNAWWEYARKKLACEEWLRAEGRSAGLPVTLVRPSHTYSKLWVPNPVSSGSFSYARRLLEGRPVFVPDDGETPWTLTASADFAVGLAGLVGNPAAIGEAFHITSDEVLTWNRIVAEIASALGVESPRVLRVPTDRICEVAPRLTGNLKGDKAHPGIFDNAKIKRFVPDFQCRIPFREGVRESVAWLLAHPEHQNLSEDVERMCDDVAARS